MKIGGKWTIKRPFFSPHLFYSEIWVSVQIPENKDIAKPSLLSPRGGLIMTKCSNTHNSHFILQKSFSGAEQLTYLYQNKWTVARATSVLWRGGRGVCQAGQVLPRSMRWLSLSRLRPDCCYTCGVALTSRSHLLTHSICHSTTLLS